MYAVIETGGKQYRVELGSEIAVERLDGEPGQTLEFEHVLLVADGDEAAIGRPLVEGAHVSASVVRQDRGDKVVVFKYKPKARRRVKRGHRQDQTVLRVADIVYGSKSAARLAEDAKTERQRLEAAVAAAAAERAAADKALAERLAQQAAAEGASAAEGSGAGETAAEPTRTRGRRGGARAGARTAGEETAAGGTQPATGAGQVGRAEHAPEEHAPDEEAAAAGAEDSGAQRAETQDAEVPGTGAQAPDPGARPRRTRARKDE